MKRALYPRKALKLRYCYSVSIDSIEDEGVIVFVVCNVRCSSVPNSSIVRKYEHWQVVAQGLGFLDESGVAIEVGENEPLCRPNTILSRVDKISHFASRWS